MLDNFSVVQGTSLTISVTLKDSTGAVVTSYSGAEALTTSVWPGGERSASFSPATTWTTPAAGLISIAISAAQTAGLVPGTFNGESLLDDGGTLVNAYNFTLTVLPAPGGIPATPTSGSITRLAVELELVDRAAALLLLCGKSTMADGNSPALGGAIGFGLQALGVTPVTPGVVTDADLANLDPARFFALCDLSEYRLLKSCLNNFAQPDQSTGQSKISLNAMMLRYKAQLDSLELQYRSLISIRKNPVIVGAIKYQHPTPNTASWGLGNGRYDH